MQHCGVGLPRTLKKSRTEAMSPSILDDTTDICRLGCIILSDPGRDRWTKICNVSTTLGCRKKT